MVGCLGCVLTAVQLEAVLTALFMEKTALIVTALVAAPSLTVPLLAGYAFSALPIVPFVRRTRGQWGWAAGVYACGTAGTLAAAALSLYAGTFRDNAELLFPCGGICYALAAAFFLPGKRARQATLAATALFVVTSACVTWSIAQPPTLREWLTANGVDRTLLRVGEPPSGYTLEVNGAGEEGFGATYTRPGAPELHLAVERTGRDTRRADARGCPVPFGETLRCADDGEGRLLITHEGDYPQRELRLRRNGLVHTVTVDGSRTDLSAARHILTTLRPATDTELAPLTTRPMRR
ncbi:hypothetical protein AB0D04_08295 [Streptomyces sp. NPDC048483]|uniref:hypothetical protein n=1 Tax=Streptomyces sp. NPDC048483 TaxID=3154927 RepID=UPI00342F5BDD